MLSKLKFIVYISTFMAVIVIAIFSFLYFYYQDKIPDYKKLIEYKPLSTTRIYSDDGVVIGESSKKKKNYISYKNIPDLLVKAVISAEDKNFFEHKGVDIFGIVRATISNLVNSKNLQGGSTITQQLIKNLLLTNERTLTRKLKEIVLALKIESVLSKEKIMELYLNEIYLGSGAYGIASASKIYFNKTYNNLSIHEMALIAALPKAPSSLNPFINPKGAINRRNNIINLMQKNDFISIEEAKAAILKPLSVYKGVSNTNIYKYFTEEVKKEISTQSDRKIDTKDGLSVFSTLDTKLQKYAHYALRNGLLEYSLRHSLQKRLTAIPVTKEWLNTLKKIDNPKGSEDWHLAIILKKNIESEEYIIGLKNGEKGVIKFGQLDNIINSIKKNDISYIETASDIFDEGDIILVSKSPDNENIYEYKQIPEINGAIVVLDPKTGKILAMDSGFSFDISKFNRATQALRQPGSAFKPFVYLTALENGYTPASIIEDEPIQYEIVNNYLGNKKNKSTWTPKNHSGNYYGATTLRKALEMSRNVSTVKLAIELGMDKIKENVTKFNVISSKSTKKQFPITAVLGSLETTLLNLTASYGMIANGGYRITPFYIDYINDKTGKTIYRANKNCLICNSFFDLTNAPEIAESKKRIANEQSIYQLISILQGVIKRGTGRKASFLQYPIAGKTGTTNNSKDAWFVGFTTNLVVGVYVGFDKPKSLGKYEEGASVALPIFIDFMEKALALYPPQDFTVPNGLNFIPIDKETGYRASLETKKNNIIMEVFKNGNEPKILNDKTINPIYRETDRINEFLQE